MKDNTNFLCSEFAKLIFATGGKEHTEWFGYYNYDPLSADHSKMLMNRASIEGKAVTKGDIIEVGYYTISDGQWHAIGISDSFNWQQGAMLQWMPDNADEIIFNFSNGENYASKIVNIQTAEEKIIDFPIYDIHPSGKFALGLDYERLFWCRAYHYQPIQKKELNVKIKEGDGIFYIDLTNNTRTLLIDIKDIVALDADPDFDEAKHWIEHIMISPSGEKFVFLHRFSYGDVMSYGTRLCIADIDGSNLKVVEGWRKYGWSHFGWCKDDSFAIYTYIAPKIGGSSSKPGTTPTRNLKQLLLSTAKRIAKGLLPSQILNKMVGKASYYQYYKVQSGTPILSDTFGDGYFAIDGHPSFTADGQYMITDTYPDKKGIQRLLVMNVSNKKTIVLATFEAPLRGTPASCDLHPKLSRDNNCVAVDTAHTGRHQMMLFHLEWDKIKSKIG